MVFVNDYKLNPADSARIKCHCGAQATTGQNNGGAPFNYTCDACAELCRQTGHFYGADDARAKHTAAISQEIGKAADAMNEMHARRFTRRLRNQPLVLTFDVEHPGELQAGLRAYSDRVTVTVDSGDPGGDPGEFETFIQESLSQWFDGAAVGIRPENLPKNAYPVARKGRIEYVTVPED